MSAESPNGSVPTPSTPNVVIVGGGFAGLDAARAMRKAPVEITLVDRHNHHLFQPLLYQVATAVLSPQDIAQPIRSLVRGQENVRVLMGEVVDVDLDAQRVLLDDGSSLPYDALIVAAGVSHAYFGNDQWAPLAPGLKTLDDALNIRSRVLRAFEEAEKTDDPERRAALLTFVVVGGGPTGVELAGAIAETGHQSLAHEFDRIDPRQARIVLVEAVDRVLPPFPKRLSRKALQALEALGVETRFGKPVTEIAPGSVKVGDETIPAGTVLWAAGVQAEPIGKRLGGELDRAGRVKVAPDLSVPNHPNVFVAGDLAAVLQPNGKPVPGVAPAAKQQGQLGGLNAARLLAGEATMPFRYQDKGSLAIIGRNRAVAHIGRFKLSGFVAWFLWLTIHLAYLNGFRNRLIAVIDWLFMYLTFRRGARLISGAAVRDSADSDTPSGVATAPAEGIGSASSRTWA